MEAGIVGLPNVGKSMLFNALTAAGVPTENYPFCTIEPNVGVVPVPDERLQIIAQHVKTKSITPATVRVVDIAGLVKGASKGEGLGNQFLSHIRNVDAILHVVRCFEDDDVAHVDVTVDPLRDVEVIETELLLADLQSIDGALGKAKRVAKTGDKEAKLRVELLEVCSSRLNDAKPIRGLELDPVHGKLLKSFGMLTAKPVLWVANVDESDLTGQGPLVRPVRDHAEQTGGMVVPVCAKLESELIELDEADRAEMLVDLGLAQPALAVLSRAVHQLLGLHSFFTTRSAELRAWTVRSGATAPEAAGVIHSDFQRGFIRVEVYTVADLQQYKDEHAIKAAGKLRVEGKDYVIQDGDVCHFLFNV